MDQPGEAVTLGDKSVEILTLDRYRGRKGQKDRIAIVGKALLRGTTHYFSESSFRCLTEKPEALAICCEKLGAPQQRFAVVVFHYASDQEGEVLVPEKCQGILKIWLLSENRYQDLSTLHKQWPLMDAGFGKEQHDLIISCTEEKYQRMTVTPLPKAHWKSKEEWYNVIARKAEWAKDKMRLALGKKLSQEEVLKLLAPPTNPVQTTRAGDVDLSDILEKANV